MTSEELKVMLDEFLAQIMQLFAEQGMSGEEGLQVAEEEMRAVVNVEADAEANRAAILENIEDIVGKAVQAELAKRAETGQQIKGAFSGVMNAMRQEPATPKSDALPVRQARVEQVRDRRFDYSTAEELALGIKLLSGARIQPSEGMLRAAVTKMFDDAERGRLSTQTANAFRAAVPFRADEINATNISGQGQDWVGVFYDNQVWTVARDEPGLLNAMIAKGMVQREIPQGHGSVIIPLEGSDPVAYSAPQANDLVSETSRVEATANVGFFGTSSATMTPGQVKLAVAITDELVEDAIVPQLSWVNQQMMAAAREQIEYVIINGDTATDASTNINLIDGTPGTGISRPAYLAANGLRKYPLVTNTAYARDASGGLGVDDFRLLLAKFGAKVQGKQASLLFLLDVYTRNSALAIPEIQTMAERGVQATVETGGIDRLYGVDVYTSGELAKSNTSGKISETGGNNAYGQILAVYAPYWAFGYKRDISMETQRDIVSGVTYVVASMRFGFLARGADASAISYNVGLS